VTDHRATALDQLRLADNHADCADEQHLNFLAGAIVHALLAVAEALEPPTYTVHAPAAPSAEVQAAMREALRRGHRPN
jgi:hypothetical protein